MRDIAMMRFMLDCLLRISKVVVVDVTDFIFLHKGWVDPDCADFQDRSRESCNRVLCDK